MRHEASQTTRRGFIAAVGAGVAALSTQALAQSVKPRSTDRKVRIGVVGGNFGAGFHWHEDPNCIVEAVSDLVPDRLTNLQQRYGCAKTHACLEELILDDALDAVAVYTGAPDHVRHCVAAMNRGKHVICAVPCALTLEECEELIEAKERNGVRYMMSETSYYRWPTITARTLYERGEFGELKYSEGEYYHPTIGTEANNLLRVPGGDGRSWRWGLTPMLYPTHSTGFLVGVTRERLTEVSCLATKGKDPAFLDNAYDNRFDNMSAVFRTSGENVFRCNVMWNVWNHGERAQWLGTRLSLFMSNWAGGPEVLRTSDGRTIEIDTDYWKLLPEAMRYDSGHGGSHPFLTYEFISAILEDREPAVNVYEAVAMTAPGIVATESARRGGERLRVPSFDRGGKTHG